MLLFFSASSLTLASVHHCQLQHALAGVDLYVLERALLSTHTDIPDFFGSVMDAYLAASTDADAVKSKFEAVRLRGRKRMAFG